MTDQDASNARRNTLFESEEEVHHAHVLAKTQSAKRASLFGDLVDQLSLLTEEEEESDTYDHCFSTQVCPSSSVAEFGLLSLDSCIFGRSGSGAPDQYRCQDQSLFDLIPEGVVFGVFDGHGSDGREVAECCAKELASCIRDDQSYYLNQSQYVEAIRGGMSSLEIRLNELPRVDLDRSGCTATIGLIVNKELYLANCGDSRAIGGRVQDNGEGVDVVQLSKDHLLDKEEEAERIVAAGGVVRPVIINQEFVGPMRCWYGFDGADLPGLMISRVLGDKFGRCIGVNAEPSVCAERDLSYLVVASDGVWDVFSNEDVLSFVHATRLKKEERGEGISASLLREAKKRWLAQEGRVGDDMSCVVICFQV